MGQQTTLTKINIHETPQFNYQQPQIIDGANCRKKKSSKKLFQSSKQTFEFSSIFCCL